MAVSQTNHVKPEGHRRSIVAAYISFSTLIVLAVLLIGSVAGAAQAPVALGTADGYAVLAGSTVTNTGPSVVNGDLGVSPGSAITGFPPGIVNGTIHAADAPAAQGQSDVTIAYNDAAGRACDFNLTGQDLGGLTLTAGTHCFSSSAQLTGTVTLNGQGDPLAVFIFQIGTTLTTASASTVAFINGTQACNVFWQVGSSATLGTSTTFRGSILALTSITLNTTASIENGRALARNGAVTMDNNVITRATCATPTPTATVTPTPTTTPTTALIPSPSSSLTLTQIQSPSPSPSPSTSNPTPTSTSTSTSTLRGPGLPNTGMGHLWMWPLGTGSILFGLALLAMTRQRRPNQG